MNDVGRRIAAIRIRRNLTQEQLGAAIGESKQTIYKYEKGIITNIPLPKVEKIAEALGCSPTVLAGWDDAVPEEQKKDDTRDQIDALINMLTPEEQRLVVAQLQGIVQSQAAQDARQES